MPPPPIGSSTVATGTRCDLVEHVVGVRASRRRAAAAAGARRRRGSSAASGRRSRQPRFDRRRVRRRRAAAAAAAPARRPGRGQRRGGGHRRRALARPAAAATAVRRRAAPERRGAAAAGVRAEAGRGRLADGVGADEPLVLRRRRGGRRRGGAGVAARCRPAAGTGTNGARLGVPDDGSSPWSGTSNEGRSAVGHGGAHRGRPTTASYLRPPDGSPRWIRRVVLATCVLGIAGMIVASIARAAPARRSPPGWSPPSPSSACVLVTAVAAAGGLRAARWSTRSAAADVERRVHDLVAAGADEAEVRSLVRAVRRLTRSADGELGRSTPHIAVRAADGIHVPQTSFTSRAVVRFIEAGNSANCACVRGRCSSGPGSRPSR